MKKKSKIGLLSSVAFSCVLVPIMWALLAAAPVVLSGEEVNIDKQISHNAPLEIKFSRRMLQSSVKRAFSISPKIPGTFSWPDGKTLHFSPENDLGIGEHFEVSIASSARSLLGKSLPARFTQIFHIANPPRITLVSPVADFQWQKFAGETRQIPATKFSNEKKVAAESPTEFPILQKGEKITLMFDRPVFNLGKQIDQDFFRDLIEFSPQIPGEFRPLGTQAFEFLPQSESLKMGEIFTAKVKAGFPVADGGRTQQEFSWNFETPAPALLEFSPTKGSRLVKPDQEIVLTFNQEIDLESLRQHLQILPLDPSRLVEISPSKASGKVVKVAVQPQFKKGSKVNVRLEPGIKSAKGQKVSVQTFENYFFPLDTFKVRSFSTPEGRIFPTEELRLAFTTPTTAEQVKSHLWFEPEIFPEKIQVESILEENGQAFEFEISASFEADREIKWGLHPGFQDGFGQNLQEGFSGQFSTKSFEPQMSLMTLGGRTMLFDSDEQISVFIRSRNVESVDFTVCQIDENDLPSFNFWDFSCERQGRGVQEFTAKLAMEPNAWLVSEVELSERLPLTSGAWFFEFANQEVKDPWSRKVKEFRQQFFVANANLVAKIEDEKVVVWATDFANGQPVEDMRIKILSPSGQIFRTGRTDGDGFFKFEKPQSHFNFFAIGEKDELAGFVGSTWQDGLRAWDFDLRQDWQEQPAMRSFLLTDRPIFRAGQQVNFKGIFRLDNDATLQVAEIENEKVQVEISSPTGKKLLSESLKISPQGSVHGSLQLANDAETGQHFLTARFPSGEQATTNFWVEQYRKPTFKLEFSSKRESFIAGEEFAMQVSAERFFGAPMANAKIDWHVVASDFHFSQKVESQGWWNFAENISHWWSKESQEVVASGNGQSDGKGMLQVAFPIENVASPQLFTLRATATDLNGQQSTKSETFEILPAAKLIGVRAQESFLPQGAATVAFQVLATDPAGQPLGGESFAAKLFQSKSNCVRKEGVDANFYWQCDEELVPLGEQSGTTGEHGIGTVEFANNNFSGRLKLVVEILDGEKRRAVAAAETFVASEDFVPWRRQNHDRIEISVDQQSHRVGQTAKLLVHSPFDRPVKAMITVERKNILRKFVREIESGKFLEIEIDPDFLPNVFVSATLVKGRGEMSPDGKMRKVKQQLAELESEIAKNLQKKELLQSRIAGDPEKTSENYWQKVESVNPQIQRLQRVLHAKESERDRLLQEQEQLSIAIANADFPENVPRPEMKVGLAQIFVETNEKRITQEIKTNKEFFLPGETVEVAITARDFRDQPIGGAELAVAIVDQSILALKSRPQDDIFKAFWENRDLGVQTAASLVFFTQRLNVKAQKGEKGGGGGGGVQDAQSLARKERGDFRDTALWLPAAVTNESGLAIFKFTLPDNLTTWQIWSVATTKDSRFGQSQKDFITRKKLVLTPSLPRFAVAGDHFFASTMLHNGSGRSGNFQVEISGDNFAVEGSKTLKIFLKDGQSQVVDFPGKVLGQADGRGQFEPVEISFTAKDQANDLFDRVLGAVPVLQPALSQSIATSGQVGHLSTEFVKVPQDALQEFGNLSLTLSASRVGNFFDGLADLIAFPFGCAEQTMSKHLPNVVLKMVEDRLGEEILDLPDEMLQQMVESGLAKIYRFQNSDGGFGFWEDSSESFFDLSSFMLFGLAQTVKAGFAVDGNVLQSAEDFLVRALDRDDFPGPEISLDAKAFALFALSENGRNKIATGNTLAESRDAMSLAGKISMALAFENFGLSNADLMREIEAAAQQAPRGVQFSTQTENENDWANTDLRTTAMALFAIAQDNPESPLAPKIVDFLQSAKRKNRWGGPWGTTQNTVWAILSFLKWIEESGQLHSDLRAQVHLNNESFASVKFDSESIFDSKSFLMPISKLRFDPERNEINFQKSGTGPLFFDAVLNYFQPAQQVRERNNGIGLVREFFAFEDRQMQTPILKVKKGELVRGRLTIMIPQRRNFVVINSFLPAGLEPVNFALENEDQSLKMETSEGHSGGDFWRWWRNLRAFNHREFRDDRVALFADDLGRGVFEFRFLARATTVGDFQLLPAMGQEFYRPEVAGNTTGAIFRVVED